MLKGGHERCQNAGSAGAHCQPGINVLLSVRKLSQNSDIMDGTTTGPSGAKTGNSFVPVQQRAQASTREG